MSQYATSKNPPWARGVALAQAASVGGPQSLGATILTAQASHNAAAAVVAAQTQQANQQPAGSFGPSLTALGLQVLRQETAISFGQQKNALPPVMSQPGIAMAVSMAPTTAPVGAGQMLHVSQPGIALPTTLATTQVATVSYPAPRLMGQPSPQFQAAHHQAVQQAVANANQQQQQQAQKSQQRVFTGTVTKIHDNFGFVDEDVFFQTSAIKGSMPKVCERVLVEATYNPNMPFKWNATRIQVLPNQLNPSNNSRPGISVACSMPVTPVSAGVGAVVTSVMPLLASSSGAVVSQFANSMGQRMSMAPSRRHSPPPLGMRREREARREERRERYRDREYERYSPTPIKRQRSPKRPSRSPPRRRQRIVPRYNVQIPKISLDLRDGNIVELRKRYTNLYIPSDFFCANFLWQEAFPAHRPFGLDHPCSFHIMQKDVEPVVPNDAVLEPLDADYLFSAKVMLLSTPPMEEIFQKACALAEEGEEFRENFVHPTRLVSFLVGLKGKNETVAIGGPWSPSLDGSNPDSDPSVLIKTAIRTCKALTGIDLSRCTQWYRFSEIHYRRGESTHKGRVVPKRVETVVIFLPDIWSCIPTRLEWDQLAASYKKQLQQKLREETEETNESQEDEEVIQEETAKQEPSHYSELDPKTMKVSDLRTELEARGLNIKGLKSQLIARLSKVLKAELEKDELKEHSMSKSEKEDANEVEKMEMDVLDEEKKKKEEEEKKLREERERVAYEKRFQLPEISSVLVHPSPVAKGGKFDCTIMSLSVLLDYRQEDNKEHSFEVSLFAELFNEMLMRDFGFSIYCALVNAPDLKEEEKEKKKSDKDDRKEKKEDKDEKKKKEEEESSEDEDDFLPNIKRRKEESDDFLLLKKKGEDEEPDEDKSKYDKKKKRDKKMQSYTSNPDLLLSFVYFDQSHCGYIAEKDLEEMLYIIGLNLSRSQVRKLLQKVVKKEMLHYRKLTDKPVTAQQESKEDECMIKRTIEELAGGNKKYLPVFKMPSLVCQNSRVKELDEDGKETANLMESSLTNANEPLVVYKGALLDVEKLMQQLKRSEKARADTEEKMREMQEELDEMHEAASISEQNAQKLSVELDHCNQKLKTSEEELRIAQIQVDKFQRGLGMCRDQLHLLLGSVETSLEGTPTIITNSRKPISYSSLITKSDRIDTHNQDTD